MAIANSNASMVLTVVLMLSFLLAVSFAESRSLDREPFKPAATLQCELVYGVKSGDTCFEIAEAFNLPAKVFNSFNPNLNCTALFVGQWVCLDGEFGS